MTPHSSPGRRPTVRSSASTGATCTTSTGTSSPCCGTWPTRRTSRRRRSSTPSGPSNAATGPSLLANLLLKIAHNECRQRFRTLSRRPKEVVWDERLAAPLVNEAVPTADEIRHALGQLISTSAPRSSCASSRGARTARSARSSTSRSGGGDPDLPRTSCAARAARRGPDLWRGGGHALQAPRRDFSRRRSSVPSGLTSANAVSAPRSSASSARSAQR